MRTIDHSCRICLGVKFGIEMIYERHELTWIAFNAMGELEPDRYYSAELQDGLWRLTDNLQKLHLTFPDRSALTKWVKKHI